MQPMRQNPVQVKVRAMKNILGLELAPQLVPTRNQLSVHAGAVLSMMTWKAHSMHANVYITKSENVHVRVTSHSRSAVHFLSFP